MECIYCGSTEQLTVDHVPPEAIFAKPRPSNLITVPSCESCNKSWSLDDEYFRTRVCLNDAVTGHPDVTANLPAVLRSLERKEARGLQAALLADFRRVELKTKSGIYVETRPAFNVDLIRINRVVSRIVRGLYYFETRSRLPIDQEVRTLSYEEIGKADAEFVNELETNFFAPLAAATPKVIGANTFMYRYLVHPGLPSTSVWLLVFYGQLWFFAMSVGSSGSENRSPEATEQKASGEEAL